MRAAIAQREAITPELLRVVETVAENPEQYARREGHMLHVFALYLLAELRGHGRQVDYPAPLAKAHPRQDRLGDEEHRLEVDRVGQRLRAIADPEHGQVARIELGLGGQPPRTPPPGSKKRSSCSVFVVCCLFHWLDRSQNDKV